MSRIAFTIPIVAGIGNAIMTEPMVRQLRRGTPDATVRVIAMTAAMGEVFRRIPGVEVTISGKGALNLFRALRENPIDTLIVPFPSNRWQYNALAMRSGARRVLMHSYPAGHRAWLSSMVGQRIEAVRGIHDVVQNLRLLEAVGLRPDFDDRPRFELTRQDHADADALLDGAKATPPMIAVHAGSARTILAAAKRWPVEKYAELIRRMRAQLPHAIALLEGPDEVGVAAEIMKRLVEKPGPGPAHDVAVIRLTGALGAAAGVLKRAALYVGSDSGLAHLAAAVGTRAVTLFAPADPKRVCPSGNQDLVVTPGRPCSPCFLYPWESTRPKMRCRPPYCIEDVSVEIVLEKVTHAMNRGRDAIHDQRSGVSGQ